MSLVSHKIKAGDVKSSTEINIINVFIRKTSCASLYPVHEHLPPPPKVYSTSAALFVCVTSMVINGIVSEFDPTEGASERCTNGSEETRTG